MPKFKPILRLVLLSTFVIFISCVKDINLDQIDEVVIPPKAAIDLVYFTLSSNDFSTNQGTVKKATDIVRLEFLDDDYIKNGLVQAEFQFKYTNSFSFPVKCSISFLSKNDQVRHQFGFFIQAGSMENPIVTNHTELIERANIESIRKSFKMKIELEPQTGSNSFSGELQLKSKAFYNFEF